MLYTGRERLQQERLPVEDFGRVTSLEAEAIGVPGERTFRLRLSSGRRTAALWLEKEQVQALALALMRLLARLGKTEELPSADESPPALSAFPEQPSLDFKVGRLGLGHDPSRDDIILFAYDIEQEPDQAGATLACRASPHQCHDLLVMIESIVAAGRPICRLCLSPIDPGGHVCARSNGRRPERDLETLR